jgi:hypothetical protein
MAGVPQVFEAMVASVLPRLTGGAPLLSQSLRSTGARATSPGRSRALAGRYPALSFGSYPFVKDGVFGANIVIRGSDGGAVDAAMTELAALFPGDIA